MSTTTTLSLSAAQHLVLTRIASGDTIQAAAEAAGVHRNSVLHWRRAIPSFRDSWNSVQYDLAMQWREQAIPLAPLALDVLRDILANPQTPASVRLRAALAIHKIASTPPPVERVNASSPQAAAAPQGEASAAVQTLAALLQRFGNAPDQPVVQPETMHNPAQSPEPAPAPTPTPAVPAPPQIVQPETVHNPAQRRYSPQELAEAFPDRPAITLDPEFTNTPSGKLFERLIQRKQSEILALRDERAQRNGKKAA